MNPLFWSLYVPVVIALFALSLLVRSLHPIRWWRYRSIRRERDAIAAEQQLRDRACCRSYVSPHPHVAINSTQIDAPVGYMVVGGTAYVFDADGIPSRKMTVADADRILDEWNRAKQVH